ncbi:hypothetical protein ABSL23_17360 (plasmid) [Halobacterium sp. NMX12-1]|uniref:Uncharacterized protein n=1 Tax=Halobacterium sp. NMX12-1 TaxID=3166650 RepID=A0AAU8CHG9_9EURY
MNTLTCANPACTDALHADSDHVRVEAEKKRMRDRDETQEYYFHPECWTAVSASWEKPA